MLWNLNPNELLFAATICLFMVAPELVRIAALLSSDE
jgi:hypothetical protein